MKLRLRGNSLRLRLRQPEVARLATGQPVEETTVLGPGPAERLICRLVIGNTPSITAAFKDGVITVTLPVAQARAWAGGPEVGLSQETAEGLRLTVEKDFRCLETRPEEDDADAFDRPAEHLSGTCGSVS